MSLVPSGGSDRIWPDREKRNRLLRARRNVVTVAPCRTNHHPPTTPSLWEGEGGGHVASTLEKIPMKA